MAGSLVVGSLVVGSLAAGAGNPEAHNRAAAVDTPGAGTRLQRQEQDRMCQVGVCVCACMLRRCAA